MDGCETINGRISRVSSVGLFNMCQWAEMLWCQETAWAFSKIHNPLQRSIRVHCKQIIVLATHYLTKSDCLECEQAHFPHHLTCPSSRSLNDFSCLTDLELILHSDVSEGGQKSVMRHFLWLYYFEFLLNFINRKEMGDMWVIFAGKLSLIVTFVNQVTLLHSTYLFFVPLSLCIGQVS